jgi:erythromycin esterase-like protein
MATEREETAVARAAIRLSGGPDDLDALINQVGDARLVLLGEASHGTHEFYRLRAELTQRLIAEKGFHGEPLRRRRLERAIGVIYRPETERLSHYFQVSLPDQFDAVVHLDQTRAVEPLEATTSWHRGDVPETFPSAV